MMKKLSIYYGCHLAIDLILLIVFNNYINLHILSLLPIFFVVLMIIQILVLKDDTASDTTYSVGVGLTKQEETCQRSYLRHAFLLSIPFEFPLVLFLPSYLKLICIVPYILSYILGSIVFRFKMSKQIQDRMDREKNELEEQKRREELGLK